MQQEQQAKSDFSFDDFKEDDVLAVKRQEAKEIYEQFRQLSEKNEIGMTAFLPVYMNITIYRKYIMMFCNTKHHNI